MAKQTIDIGAVANDGTGDPLRTAFNKVNENFTEVYDIAQDAFDAANNAGGGGGGGNSFNQDLNTSNNVTFNQIKTGKVIESFVDISNATDIVTHDCTNNHIFYHTSLDANFTANFTNLSLANSEATSLTLVLDQGGTAYIANAVQIEGTAQTIKWSANTVPTGNTNAVDVQSFSVLRVSGNYIVLGQLSTFE